MTVPILFIFFLPLILYSETSFYAIAPQVQFDEREDTKVCTIVINDDQVFENIESFNVELSMPVYALLGPVTKAKVVINDTEDEPTLQFDKKTYHVNESTGFVFVPIERKGQLMQTFYATFVKSDVDKRERGSLKSYHVFLLPQNTDDFDMLLSESAETNS